MSDVIQNLHNNLFGRSTMSKDNRTVTQLHGKLSLLCLGDSHIGVFNYIKKNGLLRDCNVDITLVGAATAQGLVNPNSKTDALNILRKQIDLADRHQIIILQMGEVDCGFVIWYYAEKYAVSMDEQLDRSLNNYFSFIKETREKGFQNIIVLSAPLPTIPDGQDWGEVPNLRREIKASQRQRTQLTIKYNERLSILCKKSDIRFIDTTLSLLDENTGVINTIFQNNDRLNHHLDDKAYAQLICGLLEKELFDLRS